MAGIYPTIDCLLSQQLRHSYLGFFVVSLNFEAVNRGVKQCFLLLEAQHHLLTKVLVLVGKDKDCSTLASIECVVRWDELGNDEQRDLLGQHSNSPIELVPEDHLPLQYSQAIAEDVSGGFPLGFSTLHNIEYNVALDSQEHLEEGCCCHLCQGEVVED